MKHAVIISFTPTHGTTPCGTLHELARGTNEAELSQAAGKKFFAPSSSAPAYLGIKQYERQEGILVIRAARSLLFTDPADPKKNRQLTLPLKRGWGLTASAFDASVNQLISDWKKLVEPPATGTVDNKSEELSAVA